MSFFDLDEAARLAEARMPGRSQGKPGARRADAGESRLPAPVAERLRGLLLGRDRPSVRDILRELGRSCEALGYRTPTRATVYSYMAKSVGHEYRVADLPPCVRAALYNIDQSGTVPGHQLAFYALNYGGIDALMFAAGLPWLDLYQAARLRGWRPKSRALVDAIAAARAI